MGMKNSINSKIKRLFIVGDNHFGVKLGSLEWHGYIKSFFRNFLIPYVKKNLREGDHLILMGDLFETKQIVYTIIADDVKEIIAELAAILGVHIIIGNHDIAKKKTNKINIPDVTLEGIENIKIYSQPEIIHASTGESILIMPWNNTPELELGVLNEYRADYCFCHTFILGFNFNGSFIPTGTTNKRFGNDISDFAHFKRVYSGHVHWRQEKDNIVFVGSPYHLTRHDTDNQKGIYLFDFETHEEVFVENNLSPQYKKIDLHALLNMTHSKAMEFVHNSFVDIITPFQFYRSFPSDNISSKLSHFKELKYIPDSGKDSKEDETDFASMIGISGVEYKKLDVMEKISEYVETLGHGDKMKENLLMTIGKLYKSAEKQVDHHNFGQ